MMGWSISDIIKQKNPYFISDRTLGTEQKTRGCIKCVILFGLRNIQADFLISS